jgi:hypothetical protein
MSGLKEKKKVKPRFKETESFLHNYAKKEIASWIEIRPELLDYDYKDLKLKTVLEQKQECEGLIKFIPDVTVIHPDKGIVAYIEVVHKSPITLEKLNAVKLWITQHEWWGTHVIEISAQWILTQTQIPNSLFLMNKYYF